jgi:hypothetical protein
VTRAAVSRVAGIAAHVLCAMIAEALGERGKAGA